MNKVRGCPARRYNDQMSCHHCGTTWDIDDPEPPVCPKAKVGNDAIAEMVTALSRPPVKLLELKETPINWLPTYGIREGLYLVKWASHPDIAFAVVSKPEKAPGRTYRFLTATGEPVREITVSEGGQSHRRVYVKDGLSCGMWVNV